MQKSLILLIFIFFISISAFPQNQNQEKNINRWTATKTITIEGEVVKVQHPLAELKASDGKTYTMRLGPLWFWNKNKYELKVGEKTEVKGSVAEENGKLYLFPSTIIQNKTTITLTGDTGQPLWSKSGKGMGKQGRKN